MVGIMVDYSKDSFKSVYNTDILKKIKSIELEQSQNLKKNINNLDLLYQFNELKFDNNKLPIPINDTNNSIKGLNNNLSRDIEFQNNYSLFQNNNSHYQVIS